MVYVLNGTDPEGDPVRYGLTFEKGNTEFFRVDSKSGNVTLIKELDREVRSHKVRQISESKLQPQVECDYLVFDSFFQKQSEISVQVSITDGRNKVSNSGKILDFKNNNNNT